MNKFQNMDLEDLPGYRTIMGLQFENLILKNRSKIWDALGLKPVDIVMDNPFFQRHTKVSLGCQTKFHHL